MATAASQVTGGSSYAPGWYAVVTSTGASGFVRHNGTGQINVGPNGQVVNAKYIAPWNRTLPSLTTTGAQIASLARDLTGLGATTPTDKIENQLIIQSDTASLKNGDGGSGPTLSQLLFGPKGTTASAGNKSVPTNPSGDAQQTGPSLGGSGGIFAPILAVAARWGLTSAFVVLGLVLIVVGLTRHGVTVPNPVQALR